MRRDYSEDDDADVYKVSYCEQNMGKKIEELDQRILDVKKIQIGQLKIFKCFLIGGCCMFLILVSLLALLIVNVNSLSTGPEAIKESLSTLCEDTGWVNGKSVNLGCLWFEKSNMDYYVAENFCAIKEAHLVEILSSDQMDFMAEKLNLHGYGNKTTFWWGGATDEAKEGTWIWSQSGLEVGPFVWGEAEPSLNADRNLLCFNSKTDFLGDDCQGDCNDCNYFTICQKEKEK